MPSYLATKTVKMLTARLTRLSLTRLSLSPGLPSRLPTGGRAVLAGVGLALAGCGIMMPAGGGAGHDRDGPGDRRSAAFELDEPVRNLRKSARGNMVEYTVRGRTYRTLASAAGYRESGTASWYGAKFHGRETSSGEIFDMHAMTAAHKSLPLPTFVRVRHRHTGKSIIVKVNDRGPFIDDRLIDLSYAAALNLGIVGSGTAEVEIEALSTHVAVAGPPVVEVSTTAGVVQLGAFHDGDKAAALVERTAPHLSIRPVIIHEPALALYRVRVGPLASAAALDALLADLARMGIDGQWLATTIQ